MLLEIDAGFLEGFPFGGGTGGGVLRLQSASGECHVPRPGITYPARPLDEQQFRFTVLGLSIDQRHGSAGDAPPER